MNATELAALPFYEEIEPSPGVLLRRVSPRLWIVLEHGCVVRGQSSRKAADQYALFLKNNPQPPETEE